MFSRPNRQCPRCRSPIRCARHEKDFSLLGAGSSVWDCTLIRRLAKVARRKSELCLGRVTRNGLCSSEELLLSLSCHRIPMVQPAESRQGLNLAFTRRADFCRPTCWRVLRKPKMRPVLMMVVQVGRHQPFEMPLIQDNHVVQQVASATSHPALRNTVLPRTAKGRASWLAFHCPSQPKAPRLQTLRRGRIARIGAAVCRPRLLAIAV